FEPGGMSRWPSPSRILRPQPTHPGRPRLSSGFVPAQLGDFLTIAALANAWRAEDPTFTSGYTDRELVTIYQAALTSIERFSPRPPPTITACSTLATRMT